MLKGNHENPKYSARTFIATVSRFISWNWSTALRFYGCYSFYCLYSLLDLILLPEYKCLQHNETNKEKKNLIFFAKFCYSPYSKKALGARFQKNFIFLISV